ncbi:MAG: hypothetical protein MK212_08890, partial [Saprospiraceae bacterium]|nr:hypothetical protein [Saprospiraceae bacterium]
KGAILSKAREAFAALPSSSINLFLGAKRMEADQVYRSLLQLSQTPNFKMLNLDQLSFVLVYTKLYEELNIQPLPLPLLEKVASHDLEQTIEQFYKDGITYFTFEGFQPKYKVLPRTEWQAFLLERECLNPMIVQWANEGSTVQQAAKASFLAKCGVFTDFDRNAAFLWRSLLLNWSVEQVAELELIEDGYWRVNTLEWMANSKKGFPHQGDFLESLYALIEASETAQDSLKNWSVIYAKSDQLRLIALSKQQQYSYFDMLDKDPIPWNNLFELCDQLGRRVLHSKFIPNAEKVEERQYNIKLLSIQKQVNIAALEYLTEGAEWQAEQYTEAWKQKHDLSVYILPKAIPCQFYLYADEEQLQMIEEVDAEDWYQLDNQLFISDSFLRSTGGSVEKTLRKLLNVSALTVDALLDLYEQQVEPLSISEEHKEILDALLEQGLTVEDLRQLF